MRYLTALVIQWRYSWRFFKEQNDKILEYLYFQRKNYSFWRGCMRYSTSLLSQHYIYVASSILHYINSSLSTLFCILNWTTYALTKMIERTGIWILENFVIMRGQNQMNTGMTQIQTLLCQYRWYLILLLRKKFYSFLTCIQLILMQLGLTYLQYML